MPEPIALKCAAAASDEALSIIPVIADVAWLVPLLVILKASPSIVTDLSRGRLKLPPPPPGCQLPLPAESLVNT